MKELRSQSTLKLDKALFAIRGELTPILKSASNPFFNSKYADLPNTIQTLDPVFRNHGVLVLQGSIEDSGYEGGVALNITTELIHVESGEYRRSVLTLPLKSQDPQQLGSAVTYGRRYLWQLVAGAETEDDDGNTASFPNGKAPAKTKSKPAGKYEGPKASPSAGSQSSTSPASTATTSTASFGKAKGTPSSKKSSTGKTFAKKKETPKAELPKAADATSGAFSYQPKD